MIREIQADHLRRLVEDFVAAYPAQAEVRAWWRKPVLVTARIDDRFEALPRIATEDHALPRDLLPTAESLIVFFIPFVKELLVENRKGPRPCRNWGLAYVQTNQLITALGQALSDHLSERGFASAQTPATHNFDSQRLVSRWSHKHLGHLAGLGRMGHNCQLITPAGCSGRLGSLVTEADLGDSPLIETDQACLLKAGQDCQVCIEACPVGALSQNGFDRRRCWEYLNENQAANPDFADLPQTTQVCGKCVAVMPCSFKNPVAG